MYQRRIYLAGELRDKPTVPAASAVKGVSEINAGLARGSVHSIPKEACAAVEFAESAGLDPVRSSRTIVVTLSGPWSLAGGFFHRSGSPSEGEVSYVVPIQSSVRNPVSIACADLPFDENH